MSASHDTFKQRRSVGTYDGRSLAALFQLSAYYNNGEERIKIRERWLSKAEANVDLRKVQKGI